MIPFKLYAALGVSAALVLGFGWHKHVVSQRDDARADLVEMTENRDAFKASFATSEERRKVEFNAAKQSLVDAGKACDERIAEARRSAGAIKQIVEKPRVRPTDPITHCPVPVLVPAGELRDALQPKPFRPAGAPAGR